MDIELKRKVMIRSLIMTPALMAIPFLAAGTANYWQAWLFIVSFVTGITWHSLFLLKCAPELLERRMRAGPTAETRLPQRIIMSIVLTSFLGLFVLAGLDHRFGWSNLPPVLVIAANVFLVFSFHIFNKVCQENAFASATIELAQNHKVIARGPYAQVRHPMYAGALLFTFVMPLALGTAWGEAILLVVTSALIWRIADEEKMLRDELQGYKDYCLKVRYRLIPGIY
jgi:protein-S-isoprenylcysteine O-methyltransferase Ste14